MASNVDWLSRLLAIVSVRGWLEIRCAYGAPWNVTYTASAAGEMPYHLLLRGRAVLDDPVTRQTTPLQAGDIVLFPHGSAHVLRDVSGDAPTRTHERRLLNELVLSENDGQGERFDMLCGRFAIDAPHDRWLRHYLPSTLVVRAGMHGTSPAADHLAGLVDLMRNESADERLGGYAMLNALSSALFALVLRVAGESDEPPPGLLALAGHPRLAPAIAAMLADPARSWTLPELAGLCSMSRATFMRHFQDGLGRSSAEFLQDVRMSLAVNELRRPGVATEVVADRVGYRSVAAFRRVFTQWMGMTPGAWRRATGVGGLR